MSTYKLQPIIAGPSVAPLDSVNTTGNSIRAVQASTPSTNTWNVNDIWVDTITAGTPVIRIWTGTAWSPTRSSGASLMVDQFTGTTGNWSTSLWTTATNPPTGTGYGATLSSNTGLIATSTTALSRISRAANITSPTDVNISFSFQFDASTPSNLTVWGRANSLLDSQTGYSLGITKGQYFLSKWASYSATDFSGSPATFNFSIGTWYSARFRCVGTTIQARLWLASSAEPATWGITATDSTYTSAGTTGVSLLNANASSVSQMYLDNFVIDPS